MFLGHAVFPSVGRLQAPSGPVVTVESSQSVEEQERCLIHVRCAWGVCSATVKFVLKRVYRYVNNHLIRHDCGERPPSVAKSVPLSLRMLVS